MARPALAALFRTAKETPVPVVDLFAGPGGLGEGFASLTSTSGSFFDLRLSVEKDPVAHQTLELRGLFRKLQAAAAPEDYFGFLRGEISREELFAGHAAEAEAVRDEAWLAELGSQSLSEAELDSRIVSAVRGQPYWVLIGGPPCQAYSIAGRARNKGVRGYKAEEDHRHFLYREYLRVLAKHWPAVFVMENVKGILSSKVGERPIFQRILDDLQDPKRVSDVDRGDNHGYDGYRIYSLVKETEGFDIFGLPLHGHQEYVIESERYGIPQSRHRVILLGVRQDIPYHPQVLSRMQSLIPAGKVLKGLPRLRSGLSQEEDGGEAWRAAVQGILDARLLGAVRGKAGDAVLELLVETAKRLSLPRLERGKEFLGCRVEVHYEKDWFLDRRIGGICNSTTRAHIAEDLHRYLYASCFAKVHKRSARLTDFPPALHPEHRNVSRSLGHDNFSDRFRVQRAEEPSTTVVSHIAKDGHYYIHYDPTQCRSLTVREAARLQTFPDNYFFCGNRTEQYAQVGNAVPPLLARQIAEVVKALLDEAADTNGQTLSRTPQLEHVEDPV